MRHADVCPTLRRPLSKLTFAVVDVETTGLSPAVDRVLEVAVVRMRGDGHRLAQFDTLVSPDARIATEGVHGLRAADVASAPSFSAAWNQCVALLAGAVVVAHHAAFDLGFMRVECLRAGRAWVPFPHLCTVELADRLGLRSGSRSLGAACGRHGIEHARRHTALGDATATASLLAFYLDAARNEGIYHADLLAAMSGCWESWRHPPLPPRRSDTTMRVARPQPLTDHGDRYP